MWTRRLCEPDSTLPRLCEPGSTLLAVILLLRANEIVPHYDPILWSKLYVEFRLDWWISAMHCAGSATPSAFLRFNFARITVVRGTMQQSGRRSNLHKFQNLSWTRLSRKLRRPHNLKLCGGWSSPHKLNKLPRGRNSPHKAHLLPVCMRAGNLRLKICLDTDVTTRWACLN